MNITLNESFNQSVGPSTFEIQRRNGFVEGYNDGFTEAVGSFEYLILILFACFVLELVASYMKRRKVKLPFLNLYQSVRFYDFVKRSSWSAAFFFAIWLTYLTQFPFAV